MQNSHTPKITYNLLKFETKNNKMLNAQCLSNPFLALLRIPIYRIPIYKW